MSNSLPGSASFSELAVGPYASRLAPVSRLVSNLLSTLDVWHARSRQRRALGDLAEFNGHLLRDIGISRDEALRETAKWFWQK